MTSREHILNAVLQNQPEAEPLQDLPDFPVSGSLIDQFVASAEFIGGRVCIVSGLDEVEKIILDDLSLSGRVISTLPELSGYRDINSLLEEEPHSLQDVKLAVIRGHFGVAENSAIWVTDELMGQQVLPFIAEHLAIVIHLADIVPAMHQAYQRIAEINYQFGTFIAGPSKTADIEQSLVRGAHGPRSLTVFLLTSGE